MDRIYGLGEVARMTGVLAHRIRYAIDNGYFSEPTYWIGRKRGWTTEDVRKLAEHFDVQVNWQAADRNTTQL